MKMPSNPVWPIPQEMTLTGDMLPLEAAVITVPAQADQADAAPARLFAEMLADEFEIAVPVVKGPAPAGKIPIAFEIAGRAGAGRLSAGLPGPEGYLLEASADGAYALGRDARGAIYAASTLIQLTQREGRLVVLHGARVRDWPYKPVRMVHLYLPGPDHLGYARRYLRDVLLRYKYNGLFVELGGGVRLPDRPEIAVGWRRFVDELCAIGDTGPIYGEHVPLGPKRRFAASVHTHLADGRYIEPDDLQRLAGWASDYHLEFVPEIQSLSHAYYLASVYREVAELPEADFPDSYCPLHPQSRAILFEVMQALIDLTGCRSVHIGHDEWRAGGLCEKCRERDTGELFADDVLEIAAWLKVRNLGVWMWGDHLIPLHNGKGGSHAGGKVWYDHPQTMKAGKLIAQGAPDIRILNWSWSLGSARETDRVIGDLGFQQIYGNFSGRRFEDWPGRSAARDVLGAEVSSWCAWNDFELGLIHYPAALYAANLMWSTHWPPPAESDELTARQMPRLRDRMRRLWEKPRLWSEAVETHRMHPISITQACNAPLKTSGWDLSGLQPGSREESGIPLLITDPAQNAGLSLVAVERQQVSATDYPHRSAPIPIGTACASLIFWQVADREGGRPMHAGDGTHYPREAAELLGWYEIRFADGLIRLAEIRYDENLSAWNQSWRGLYHAREVRAGNLPDGRPLVLRGLEWTSPRPHIPIESVTLHGAGSFPAARPAESVSAARPLLVGITAVEGRRWEDYRPDKTGKLPGCDG